MTGQIQRLGREASSARDLFLLHVSSPAEIPDRVDLASPHFACLLVWDAAGESPDVISAVSTHLLKAGCSYFCAWGTDCERVHDIFDEEEVGDGINFDEGAAVLTTWHAKDSIDETLRYFLKSTDPMDRFRGTTKAALAIVIGSDSQVVERTRFALAHPDRFLAEVVDAGDA